jgi:Co/Zn/Cd efflux system component
MGIACCAHETAVLDQRYRRVLGLALILNALMCVLEIVAAWHATSTALLADSMDFMADSVNYGVTLFALSLSVTARAKVALAKGVTMILYGFVIVAVVGLGLGEPHPPQASLMGGIALLALLTNFGIAILLFKFREGDSNRQAVWLCTRNDAIANVLVLVAAIGVWLCHSRWPDLVVALIIGLLGLSSGLKVIRQARREMRA